MSKQINLQQGAPKATSEEDANKEVIDGGVDAGKEPEVKQPETKEPEKKEPEVKQPDPKYPGSILDAGKSVEGETGPEGEDVGGGTEEPEGGLDPETTYFHKNGEQFVDATVILGRPKEEIKPLQSDDIVKLGAALRIKRVQFSKRNVLKQQVL